MKFIPHNSFSYLPIKNRILSPFSFLARCQNESIIDQIINYNAAGLDLRIRFNQNGEPVIAHGLISYDGDIYDLLKCVSMMVEYNHISDFSARVMLETTFLMDSTEYDRQKYEFKKFCKKIQVLYNHINFWGGWSRREWRKKIYDFRTKEPEMTEMHGSVSGNKLWCLNLKGFARKYNTELTDNCKTEYFMGDYINWKDL